jgi:hypothetical protein
MDFEEYIKITKIKEMFLEHDFESVIYEGTMQEYLKTVSNTEFEIGLFRMFYTNKFTSISFKNIYGNYHEYQLI